MKVNSSPPLRFWLRTVLGPMFFGWVYAQAFYPVQIRFMIIVGLVGFLGCLRGLSAVEARRAGFLFGLVLMAFGCAWLKNIFGWVFLVLCAVQALFFGLFGWGHAIIYRQVWSRWRKTLAIAALWTGVEFVRAEHFWLDFPWMTPGHGLGVIQNLTQPLLSSVGVYGIGFVVVILLAVLDWLAKRVVEALQTLIMKEKIGFLGSAAMEVVMMLSSVIVGLIIWLTVPGGDQGPSSTNDQLRHITFAAIQAEHGSFPDFVATTKALSEPHDLILWPEEALPYDVARSKHDWPLLLDLAKQKNCVLVTGTQQQGKGTAWWNTSLTIDPTGELGRHYKIHTVHLFDDGTPGTEAKPVQTKLGKIGTPICFDCDHQDVVRRMTVNGADFFAVPSMDPIPWGPVQRQMHSELFRIRAAENGRAMVVCATSGVTQAIDPWGNNVKAPLPPMAPGVLEGSLPVRTEFTFFTRFGWLFPWLCLVSTVAVTFQIIRRERHVERPSIPLRAASDAE